MEPIGERNLAGVRGAGGELVVQSLLIESIGSLQLNGPCLIYKYDAADECSIVD